MIVNQRLNKLNNSLIFFYQNLKLGNRFHTDFFLQTNLEIQRERIAVLLRQQEASERDALTSSEAHSDQLRQIKEQFAKERAAIRKQLQLQISEVQLKLFFISCFFWYNLTTGGVFAFWSEYLCQKLFY